MTSQGEPENSLRYVVELLLKNDLERAAAVLVGIAEQYPGHPRVLCNQGRIAWRRGLVTEAISCWRESIARDPCLIGAMVDLASAMFLLGEVQEAARLMRRAVELDPSDADLHANLAQALNRMGDAEALVVAERGLACEPRHARCRQEAVVALFGTGDWLRLISEAGTFLADPGGMDESTVLAMLGHAAAECSAWDELDGLPERILGELQKARSTISPTGLCCLLDDPQALLQAARRRARNVPAFPSVRNAPLRRDGRITLGYLSPDYRTHPVAHMLRQVLPWHDRGRFRIVGCSMSRGDGSPVAVSLRQACDEWIDLAACDDDAAVSALRGAGIDVLVDLVGVTQGARPALLARRAAPVQLLWLGCPTTTGMSHYDGFIVDAVAVPPGSEQDCSEPIVRLPCCYHPIGTGEPDEGPSTARSHGDSGQGSCIVGLIQDRRKVMPRWAEMIARVVGESSSAHLQLRIHPAATSRILERLAGAGLPQERVRALPRYEQRRDYLAACRGLDVVVDTYPFGGHSTTGELLSMGVPVLSMAGNSLHARVGASMLHEFGLQDLVARSPEDLCRKLRVLVSDANARRDVQERCRSAASAYREAGIRRLVASLEATYGDAVAKAAAAGSSPPSL